MNAINNEATQEAPATQTPNVNEDNAMQINLSINVPTALALAIINKLFEDGSTTFNMVEIPIADFGDFLRGVKENPDAAQEADQAAEVPVDDVFVGADDHDNTVAVADQDRNLSPYGYGSGATDDEKRGWAVEMGVNGKRIAIIATREDVVRDDLPLDDYDMGEYANLYREKDGYAKLGSERFSDAESAADKANKTTNWLGVVELRGDMPVARVGTPLPEATHFPDNNPPIPADAPFGYGEGATNESKRTWFENNVSRLTNGEFEDVMEWAFNADEAADSGDGTWVNVYREADGYAKLGSSRFDNAASAVANVNIGNTNWLGTALVD